MCGIVGYVGNRKAAELIFNSLKQLDYRGYDSCGIATLSGIIRVKKDAGKIAEIHAKHDLKSLPGTIGIGHTRWATHGIPNQINAHPHTDCSGEICIVHNGVIENYNELKFKLMRASHKFVSETDTEIIAHLVEEEAKGKKDIFEAFKSAAKQLKGSYAILLLHKNSDKIFVARNESPIVIGLGKGENFCASDISALLDYTRDFVLIEDGEFAIMSKQEVSIFKDGKRIQRKPLTVKWTPEMAKKEGYEHFTLKEIHEQPRAITDTLAGELDPAVAFLRNFKKIQVVAAGTSYHAGVIFRYLLSNLTEIPCETIIASEYSFLNPPVDKETLILAISQSGETADTLLAVRRAKKKGAKVLALVNVLGSSLTREADEVIYTHAGPEISVVSTKAFTSQVAALSYLVFKLAGKEKLIAELKRLPDAVRSAINSQGDVELLAKKLKNRKDFFFIGRGLSYPVAMEGALKLKEISYLHAEAYPGGELKHGPLSLLEKGVPVIAVVPNDEASSKMIGNIRECISRGAEVIAISNSEQVLAVADVQIPMPHIEPLLSPILFVIPLQLLAYFIAVQLGKDPDKPRNLAKSVTVE